MTPLIPEHKRHEFPATGVEPPRGTALLIHGHGDHAARYATVLLPFRERGITCFATDQPGHGESPGRRGAIPGVSVIDAIIDRDLARAAALGTGSKPVLIGHSAGGLLAMRELLRHPDTYRAAWISSPLVWPEKTRHPVMVALLLLLGCVIPGCPLATGVTDTMCRRPSDAPRPDAPDPLHHNRITLGWARALVAIARQIRHEFPARRPAIPLLFTQGGDDPVCPAGLLRDFLATIDHPALHYEEFEGFLHEPFADARNEEVHATVARWIDAL